jgi:peptide/nickel transport system ATP-binding protein
MTIRLKDLSIAFKNPSGFVSAVDGLTFTINPGETLAILGESGCGKSLTSSAIMRLAPNNAVYGAKASIIFNGQNILNVSEKTMRKNRGGKIAMIFQEPMTALNPVMTIGQQISEILVYHQLAKKDLKAQVVALLNKVEITSPSHRFHDYPHQLSGGQKQRVMIAMAIACEPELLIADEPTTALDVTIQEQILNLLKRLQQENHMSILLITHDLAVVKKVADKLCVMYAGQIVEQAKCDDFFKQVKHPYSQQLLASIPSLAKAEQRLHSIEGIVPALEDMPSGCRFHPRCVYVKETCKVKSPSLQEQQKRLVSCHLYPQINALPMLKLENKAHDISEKKDLLLKIVELKIYFPMKKKPLQKKHDVFKAVDDLSFSIVQGETLAIVGESGCGKTTVSRGILQLIPITSGQVIFDGNSLTSLKAKRLQKLRRDMQIIFQDPFSSMNPRMMIGEIIAEGIKAHSLCSTVEIENRVNQLLCDVGLPKNSIYRYPHQFSGGQRQRISIARALALKPKLIICDEPTSALDVSVQAQILNLLKQLQAHYNLAYLFITHDMSVVGYMADRVLVMRHGKMVETGSVSDVLTSPKQQYTQNLMSAVPTI